MHVGGTWQMFVEVNATAFKPRPAAQAQTSDQILQQPSHRKNESMRKVRQKLGPAGLSWTHEWCLREVETRAKWARRLW